MAAASWISVAGGTAQWASNMTAPSGPTCLRAALIDCDDAVDVGGVAGDGS